MKCSACGQEIKGKPAYIDQEMVCPDCFEWKKLRKSKKIEQILPAYYMGNWIKLGKKGDRATFKKLNKGNKDL